jgi:hypothetical protein
MKWLSLLLLVTGCAANNRYARWPYRGSMLVVQNPTTEHQIVVARDGEGREWVVARIKPRGRACFRWPFVNSTGFLRTDGEDRVITERFEPWTADGWEWQLSGQPVPNPQVCR